MTRSSSNQRALVGKGRRPASASPFAVLAAFVVFVALTGGGSRPDILSLVFLRPAAVAVAAYAAWGLSYQAVERYRFAFAAIAAIFALALLHLVPLPPALRTQLPGHALVAAVDAAAGLGAVWRPLSIAPADTVNAVFSLFVPLAALLLACRLDERDQVRLMILVIAVGLAGALLSLFQAVGPPRGPLFLYRNTNYGVATGLFANRNHHAIFLATLLPMLAASTTAMRRSRHAAMFRYGALASGAIILPLLLVTGSRVGMLAGAVGLLSVPFLVRLDRPRRSAATAGAVSGFLGFLRTSRGMTLLGLLAAGALVGLTIWMSRAASMTRLTAVGASDELRFKVWPIILRAVPDYLPLGSGVGSFVTAFKIAEPDAILRPTYLNHAHSEPLEILLTAGVPGALLLLVGCIAWAVAAWRAFTHDLAAPGVLLARTGVIVIALLGAGSVTDYPLRTPFLGALLVIASLWCSGIGPTWAKRDLRRALDDQQARLS